MSKVKVMNGNLDPRDKIDMVIEKRVTKFESGAKIDCPKEYLGKRAYILISKDIKNSYFCPNVEEADRDDIHHAQGEERMEIRKCGTY